MYLTLFLIAILVNFLFMMLTTLLPILIFQISNSVTKVGTVLTIFMISLILIRIVCMLRKVKPIRAIISGTFLFLTGFIIIKFYYTQIFWYYIGSIFFGIAIGLVPPAVLTLLTASSKVSAKNLRIYNSCVAFASALAPLTGEYIYNKFYNIIYDIWIIGALISLIASIILVKMLNNNEDVVQEKLILKYDNPLKNGQHIGNFAILLISSISYGAIVTYLPIYFNEIKFSIGLYSLIFWASYVIAQFINKYIYRTLSENTMIALLLICLCIGELIISLAPFKFMYLLSALIYGISYGLMYNFFYTKASFIKDDQSKNNVYAVIGLMSYIGVGLAPTFLSPFLKMEIRMIFAFSTIYIVTALFIHFLLHLKNNKYV